jgi:hypothetical protein
MSIADCASSARPIKSLALAGVPRNKVEVAKVMIKTDQIKLTTVLISIILSLPLLCRRW